MGREERNMVCFSGLVGVMVALWMASKDGVVWWVDLI
jgi:type IV secretory pathway TrbD component